jgi:hypothetical protein
MKKILSDQNTLCWIAMAAGVGGTALGLYLQFRSGVPSVSVMVWLTWFAVGFIGYHAKKGLANLNGRLEKLERTQ